LKLSEAQTKAISHYKKALEEAIAEFVEHLNSIQKQKTQVQRDLQLVTSELTIIGKRIESQRAQLLEEHSILLLSNQIIPAQRQN
jgi:ketosteroid isomerase-like protein